MDNLDKYIVTWPINMFNKPLMIILISSLFFHGMNIHSTSFLGTTGLHNFHSPFPFHHAHMHGELTIWVSSFSTSGGRRKTWWFRVGWSTLRAKPLSLSVIDKLFWTCFTLLVKDILVCFFGTNVLCSGLIWQEISEQGEQIASCVTCLHLASLTCRLSIPRYFVSFSAHLFGLFSIIRGWILCCGGQVSWMVPCSHRKRGIWQAVPRWWCHLHVLQFQRLFFPVQSAS